MSSSSSSNNKIENVLVLQGGGSLGAFACGVFKALADNNIKLDIVAGNNPYHHCHVSSNNGGGNSGKLNFDYRIYCYRHSLIELRSKLNSLC